MVHLLPYMEKRLEIMNGGLYQYTLDPHPEWGSGELPPLTD